MDSVTLSKANVLGRSKHFKDKVVPFIVEYYITQWKYQ